MRTISFDLLHIWYLGVGRDFVGAVIRTLVQSKGFFHGSTQDARLKVASASLRRFAKNTGKPLAIKVLTKAKLQWNNKEYPMLKAKGADVATVLPWLLHLARNPEAEGCGTWPCAKSATAVWAANEFLLLYMTAGIFLTAEQSDQSKMGMLFLRMYLTLSSAALILEIKLWKVRPKLHMLHHVFLNWAWPQCRRNPHNDSTWMDEDYVKKVTRVGKKTHVSTTSLRVLQRYLLQLVPTLEASRNSKASRNA